METKNILKNSFNFIFPYIDNYKKNKKLKQDKSDNFSYIENSENIGKDNFEKIYNESLSDKSKLEDKAKTNVIGITITITLILSVSNILDKISVKYHSEIITWISFFFVLFSITYMVIAGILAIKVLVNENVAYRINLNNLSEANERSLIDNYKDCISKNRKQNLVRNNIIYTSYECIRNSIICLLIVFIMLSLPINTKTANTYDHVKNNSFMYSELAFKSFEDSNIQIYNIENSVCTYLEEHSDDVIENKFYGIYDGESSAFIKFQIINDNVNIILIEPVENNN